MGPTDSDLIRRWQDGESRAFEALVLRWQQPIARLLGHLIGRADLVPDLSQEVFLRVYQAAARYHDTGSFPMWLYRVALNVARDAGRRNRRAPTHLNGFEPVDGRPSPDTICQQRESAQLVLRAIAELPEPMRVVLVLHHYEGLNFEAIARLTETPASTLKSRFGAALGRLRQRLLPLNWEPEDTT
jgi:RNA polymerase sigma-70 factor (ECF subfamily)